MSDYQERFYKKSVLGRDENLFLRVESLEKWRDAFKAGSGSVIQNISNLIYENREIILSSIAGGTTDPTATDFTGVVISPSGQTINGVLYNFALVENGVVLTGMGQDVINNTTIIQGARTTLTADVTYYVRTDGDDDNSGLVDDATGAFLTPQKAWDTIVNNLYLNGYNATIQLRSGTYPGVNISSLSVGSGQIIIQGDSLDYDAVVLSSSDAPINIFGASSQILVRYLTLDSAIGASVLFGYLSLVDIKINADTYSVQAISSYVSIDGIELTSASSSSLVDATRSRMEVQSISLHASQDFTDAMFVLNDGSQVNLNSEVTDSFTGKGYDLKNMSRIVTDWDIIGDVANTTDGTCIVTGFIDPFGGGSGASLPAIRKSISIGF